MNKRISTILVGATEAYSQNGGKRGTASACTKTCGYNKPGENGPRLLELGAVLTEFQFGDHAPVEPFLEELVAQPALIVVE